METIQKYISSFFSSNDNNKEKIHVIESGVKEMLSTLEKQVNEHIDNACKVGINKDDMTLLDQVLVNLENNSELYEKLKIYIAKEKEIIGSVYAPCNKIKENVHVVCTNVNDHVSKLALLSLNTSETLHNFKATSAKILSAAHETKDIAEKTLKDTEQMKKDVLKNALNVKDIVDSHKKELEKVVKDHKELKEKYLKYKNKYLSIKGLKNY